MDNWTRWGEGVGILQGLLDKADDGSRSTVRWEGDLHTIMILALDFVTTVGAEEDF